MPLLAINSLISQYPAIAAVNRRNNLDLASMDLICLTLIFYFNTAEIVCGQTVLHDALPFYSRSRNYNDLQVIITRLRSTNLVVTGKYRRGLSMNLKVTALGVSVLSDFDRLLSTSKIKLV
jgi:hypothetical protein